MQETLQRWSFMGLLLVLVASLAWAGDGAPSTTPPPIAILPQDGFNLVVDEQIDSHYVVVKLASPAHNWFAGKFTNLPTDKEVTIGLSMAGNDTKGNEGNVKKWEGLRPVITYADPTKYETYEWFQKDAQGRWVSGDPFKQGEAKYAGTGNVPVQTAIPRKFAEQFLSKDGKYWQAWREVNYAEAVSNVNVFRMKQVFLMPTATIAMRVPYTYTFYQQFVKRIKALKIPGVFVDEIGTTSDGRNIDVIRIDDPEKPVKLTTDKYIVRPNGERIRVIRVEDTIMLSKAYHKIHLIYGREHATEPASSWFIDGIIRYLLQISAKGIRQDTTWLLLPIYDIDGSEEARFDQLANEFYQHMGDENKDDYTPEAVLCYAKYLRAFVNSGRPIVSATSIHNIECNEGPVVFSPISHKKNSNDIEAINKSMFTSLRKVGVVTGEPTATQFGIMNHRLFGWCNIRYGALPLAFEVNDRFPTFRLTIEQLCGIGAYFPMTLHNYYNSREGKMKYSSIIEFLTQREVRRARFRKETDWPEEDPSIYEYLSEGY